VIEDDELLNKVKNVGKYLSEKTSDIAKSLNGVKGVRSIGTSQWIETENEEVA